MKELDILVEEQTMPMQDAELVLPEDPVLRDLVIKKLNGQNGVMHVPIPTTDVTPDAADRTPVGPGKQESLLARLLELLTEGNSSPQNLRQTRGWGD